MKSVRERREELEEISNSGGMHSRDAEKALQYADELPEIADDIIRHYHYKVKRAESVGNSPSRPNYDGRVVDRGADGGSLSADIVDVTSFTGNQIRAKLIDATTIEADVVNAEVLDATTVVTDDLDARCKCVTTVMSFEEKREQEREREQQERERRQKHQSELEKLDAAGKHPGDIMRALARRLKSEYKRPPNNRGEVYESEKKDGVLMEARMDVSNVPKPRTGNNKHRGRWAIVEYTERRGWEVMLKRDGVAGNPDESKQFNPEDVTVEKLEQAVKSYV